MKKHFILFLLCICISVCFISLLQKEKKVKEYNSLENVELAIYLNDEETNSIPSKDSGYYYDREKSTCSNGAYINWDSVSWSPVVNNMSEYKTRCEIHFTTTYTEGILNGADPVLKDELVPITIENNGTVKKADLESEWYSYANKNWANAVILEDQYDSLNTQGKVQGATKQDGYVSFDGVDDYIDLGLENYDFGNTVTIAIKMKLLSYSSVSTYEFFNNFESSGLGLSMYDTTKIGFWFFNEMDNEYHTIIGPDLELNKEYSIIATYDGKSMKMYVDGILVNEIEASGTIKVSSYNFYLGANPGINGFTNYTNMDVYQAELYSRVITDEEVQALSKGKVLNSEGLLRYVDFTNKSYEDNEIIPEEKIESYFVWIPKYRYQLWDLGQYDSLTEIDASKVHEIPIIFGDYNTSDSVDGECTTPMTSGASGNCIVGDYMTHPAFLSIPSTGFWVAKFETGYNGANSVNEAEQNVNDASKVIIKPNVYSWRGIQVANAFNSSYNYQRDLDSHMMKNTEWGAVAYLQHSAYGGATRVRINNNSNFITGYQANEEPTCGWTGTNEECNRYCNDGTCNTAYPESILASTTDNVTGIFDMSGGTREYVMGVMVDEQDNPMSGRSNLYNSGFIGGLGCPQCDAGTDGSTYLATGYSWPDVKYYDVYFFSNVYYSYSKRILGDAVAELGPFSIAPAFSTGQERQIGSWYNNLSYTNYYADPWFLRGFSFEYGNDVSIFAYGGARGEATNNNSFRLILTPTRGTS